MANIRRTSEYRKLLPFIARASGDVGNDTIGEDVSALLLALETHKTSGDHDGRYYTETEMDSALALKADKTITLTAGNGLTGGGNLSENRTFNVVAGDGILVTNDAVNVLAGLGIDFDSNGAVIVDLTENYAWTGNHSFTKTMYAGSIMPHNSDTYDLGSSASLWRKIWGSELSAVVFAQYEQVLLGGWFTVSKGEGVLPADILSTDTTIDLGADTFDVGDIIVFRGISATNTPQVEYIKIASDLPGTLYGVTRDLDGTGANDWQTGTVFANYGRLGDGRIELNAYDSPRMSVFSHSDTIANFREQVRIGDLINGWGYSASTYGAAFGAYQPGKANITIDPTNGIRIRNYDQTVIQLTGTEAVYDNPLSGDAGIVRIDPQGFHYHDGSYEYIRIGALDGWDGGAFTGLKGIAIGDYQANWFMYDPTNGLRIKGNITATSGTFTGTVYASDGSFTGTVYASDGEFNGTVYASAGEFNGTVYATDGEFNGTVYASAGEFTGTINANSGYLNDLSIDGTLTLGTSGKLLQGSGTWQSSFTGSAIWSDSGIMNIGGWNNNVKQWWGGSDGKFYANNGNLLIDINGVNLSLANWYNDYSKGTIWGTDNINGAINNTSKHGLLQFSHGVEVQTTLLANDPTTGGRAETLIESRGGIIGSLQYPAFIRLASDAYNNDDSTKIEINASKISLDARHLPSYSGIAIMTYNDIDLSADSINIIGNADISGNLVVDGTIKDGSGIAYLKGGTWQDWTPTQTGWTALPTGVYRYCLIGKICFFIIDITAGTSNGTVADLTLPYTVKSGAYYGGVNGMCMDNGTVLTQATKWYIDTPVSQIRFGTDMGTGLFTASGTKRIRCEGFYEIA